MCMNVFPAYMYVHHIYVWCLKKSEEGLESAETEIMNGCEPPSGFWESNQGLP